jgi:hypothetical protein
MATGLLDRDEALTALLAEPVTPALRSVLIQALDAAARAHALRRAATERSVRRAVVAPLFARLPRAGLLAAADAADPDGDLRPRERRALVEAEVAWALRTRAFASKR